MTIYFPKCTTVLRIGCRKKASNDNFINVKQPITVYLHLFTAQVFPQETKTVQVIPMIYLFSDIAAATAAVVIIILSAFISIINKLLGIIIEYH